MVLQRGIRIHQYLDDWLVKATSHQTCLQHTQTLVALSRTRFAGEQGKVRTGSKTGFQLRRLPVQLERGQGQTHTRALAALDRQNSDNLSGSVCPVRHFMSFIGLLTATEKQVHLGRLHMRPVQWHLKNNWRVPESLEKVIPVPRSLQSPLKEESNVLPGQL